ncbi:hypothetical protein BZM26_25325 [Paraburkholderia strydomiana]|nr:hypothetical protein BZM26_25325 [Paraburkholderia strydomiana]
MAAPCVPAASTAPAAARRRRCRALVERASAPLALIFRDGHGREHIARTLMLRMSRIVRSTQQFRLVVLPFAALARDDHVLRCGRQISVGFVYG